MCSAMSTERNSDSSVWTINIPCVWCAEIQRNTVITHSGPVDEVALLLKEELKTALKHFQEKLESFKEMKQSFDDAAQHIKTVRCLQEEFERLHQFLQDEEMLRISALIEEENQKSHMMNERIEQIDREIESLSNNSRAIKDDLDAANMPFLQNFMFSEERAQITLQDPEIPTGALMNVPEHLGNLRFKVWEKMQEIVTQLLSHWTPTLHILCCSCLMI
ncbi:E3 ubiquitin-protein ligase TRIM35-like isoform X2 [Chanodichthys erythropterus]|uniref:E3 ubiquitin-protein ligase TRIM35-like isoform X2 n=1 Tax=Chanodichthys erythropterus TaxID=933992 RepID=UPI00351E1A8D